MDVIESAVNYFQQGYSCSQAVLLAFAEELGLDPDEAARISAGFGGGIGGLGLTCGAVTGGIMVLGLRYGSSQSGDPSAKEALKVLVRRFTARFAEHNGSITCGSLLGHDISTPAGLASARSSNAFKSRCPDLVRSSAALLLEMG